MAVVQAVLGLRQRCAALGAEEAAKGELVKHHPQLPVPAGSTIGDWRRRERVVRRSCPRLRCSLYTQPFAAVSAANDVWCTDFKGWFRTSDGRQPDPFTLTDAHTSLPAQQERFDAFRAVYNHERPHEALGQHADGVTARPMPSNGRLKWAGELIFVGEALVGEPVGILETEGGDWLVRYADVELGYIHPQAPPAQPASTARGEG